MADTLVEWRPFERSKKARWKSASAVPGGTSYRDAALLAMADFLLAAWFLWMTPLLTALSSLVEATLSASEAAEASPESAAVLNLRTKVRSSLLTALLRSVRRALVLMRLS